MARRVFFSFHHTDIWRDMNIRNSWLVRSEREPAGYVDKAAFATVERQGRAAIRSWIDRQLSGTSVTIVLIGAETANREYVQYEILESYKRGNGLLGIYLHNMKDESGNTGWFAGPNPFDKVEVGGGIFGTVLSSKLNIPIYDWVDDNGRTNLRRAMTGSTSRLAVMMPSRDGFRIRCAVSHVLWY